MLNNLKNSYKRSFAKRILEVLFAQKEEFEFDKSRVIKLFSRFENQRIGEVILFAAIAMVLYELVFTKFTSLNLSLTSLVLMILSFVFLEKKKSFIARAYIYYLGFLFFSIISAFFAVSRQGGFYILEGWIIFAQFLLVLMLGQLIGEKIIKYILYVTLPMGFLGIMQFVTNSSSQSLWFSAGETVTTRAFGFLGSPNVLGVLSSILVISAVGLFLKNKNKIYLILSGFYIIVSLTTLSRTSWLSLIVGITIIILSTKPRLLYFSPMVFLALFSSVVRNRISFAFSRSYLTDSALDGRVWAWINGLYIFKQYPILGTGPGTYGGQLALNNTSPIYFQGIQNGYTALYFTDNQILEILVQTGILGIITFIGFAISLIVKLISKFKSNNDIIALTGLAVFIAFLISGLFANVLEFGAVAIPAGLIIGAGLSE